MTSPATSSLDPFVFPSVRLVHQTSHARVMNACCVDSRHVGIQLGCIGLFSHQQQRIRHESNSGSGDVHEGILSEMRANKNRQRRRLLCWSGSHVDEMFPTPCVQVMVELVSYTSSVRLSSFPHLLQRFSTSLTFDPLRWMVLGLLQS